ncbi:MAG: hypothetical protein ACOX56_05965 [Acholeplasmataceae bacterium]
MGENNVFSVFKNKLKINLFDIICFLIIGIATILNCIFNNKINDFIKSKLFFDYSINVVIVVLPLVLNILSIVLSLPKDKIYGLEKNEFRKFEKSGKYSFLHMLIIALFIFAIYSISVMFGLYLVILVASVIALIYSLLFLFQEIPLLTHNERRIEKIIRINVHYNLSKYNDPKKDKKILVVVFYLINKKNILYTYNILKDPKNSESDKKLFDNLLDIQNYYLWRYRENYLGKTSENDFKINEFAIVDVIDKAFENIDFIISQNDTNIVAIYKGEEYLYHLTRSLFSLRDILNKLGLKQKYEKQFGDLLSSIFWAIIFSKENKQKLVDNYKILNMMLTTTLSSEEDWFIKLLRDQVYLSNNVISGPIEYMVFVSIYLYYLYELEPYVSSEFKDKIKEFLNYENKFSNLYGNSWKTVMNRKLEFADLEEINNILVELLNIFDTQKPYSNWYFPEKRSVYSSTLSKSFNKDLFFNWWIGYVINSEYLSAYMFNKETQFKIPSLSEENLDRLASILSNEWFEDNELKTKLDTSILDFFGMENRYVNSMVVNYLKEFSNKRMKEKAIGKYKDSIKTEEDFIKYKSMLSKGMVEAIERQPFRDTTIELKDVKPVFYSYIVESLHTEKLLKMYIDDMPRALDRLILFDFKNNKEVKNFEYNISQYSEDVLNNILSFNPNYKTEYVYDFNTNEDKKKLINDVNKIPNESGVWLPRGLFYKKGAIKINVEYLEEQSFVRTLSSEEVNTIIDRDFRLVNGFYKYSETSNSKSGIMLNREEIFELISKKYLIVNLFIKYKVQYNSEKILYYKLEKQEQKHKIND